jgi:chromosome segregation protein
VRLTQIKLSGFKSFVDPTHFQIPGQLVGVVGPNGCGKSNIIDAARWVLGESKASELRGESMQDVIFNGSGLRKPAGRASVELVFDNASGRAGGQWGQYAEIAVKRVLTRDGTSTYYINSQVVRRRDIQDIFLGTGLGPRAYAIIGQGMISRIIEARPEELRIFLEEAAGVSKYKERRRETESRLADTRENLTRVEDIQRELTANLDKLEGQAEVARQFRTLEAELLKKQQWLWLLKIQEAVAEQGRSLRHIEEAQVALDARVADLRRTEAELEVLRADHFAAGDAVHAAQGALFEASGIVSSIEAEIRFVVESRNRLELQAAQLRAQNLEKQAQGAAAVKDKDAAKAALADNARSLEELARRCAEAAQHIPALEGEERRMVEAVTDLRADVSQVEQALQLESAAQRNADRHLQVLQQRRERLAAEQQSQVVPDGARVAQLASGLAENEERLATQAAELSQAEAELPRLEAAREECSRKANEDQARAAVKDARLLALRQLQESVQAHDKLMPWLQKHELSRLPRLWQRVQVDAGWETALESVLRERISALEIKDLGWAKSFFEDAPPAKLAFFSAGEEDRRAPIPEGFVTLASKVRISDAPLRNLVDEWLDGIYLADTAEDALERRSTLPVGASFVVPGGHLIDRHAARFYASDSEQAGMLARQQEIEALQGEQRALHAQLDESKTQAVQSEMRLSEMRAQLAKLRGEIGELTQTVHTRQMELQQLRSQQAQVDARGSQIVGELAEIERDDRAERAARAESEAKFEALDVRLAEVQASFEEAQLALEEIQAKVRGARDHLRALERDVAEKQFQDRSLAQSIESLSRAIGEAQSESGRLEAAQSGLQLELEGLNDTTAKTGLDDALANRILAERALADARIALDSVAAGLRAKDEARLVIEHQLEPLRAAITEQQVREQGARLSLELAEEQLAGICTDREALAADFKELDRVPRVGALQSDLNRLQQALAALGAVNLAALEELGTARDRKEFLDAQSADLIEAMTTLEDAIRKIDRETRALLQETFDAVNGHFGTLFPALFGGGDARLVMTGDEILDAGVQVMAQPPGKKNSTIHLLSGGEKALAATALVFALFQLNPAPFCLLDEVDAPLDDANTERFCELVKKMSAQTQFLFISHNKIAMEMAHQLIGVTMQEQGVSRIVAVDMDAAIGLSAESLATAA